MNNLNENNNNENDNLEKNNVSNNEESNKNNENEVEEGIKNNKNINLKISSKSKPNYSNNGFDKLKSDIINRKESFPIKIMIILCLIYIVSTISFMIYSEYLTKIHFINLSNFLERNLHFNITKMNIAIIYIVSTNIKWQIHSCNLTNPQYNMTSLYEKLLKETIDYLLVAKDEANNFSKEYNEIMNLQHEIGLRIYGKQEKERYKFNQDNFMTLFINSGINILKKYSLFLKIVESEKKGLDTQTFGINELYDLTEHTYNYFTSDVNGYKGEEKNKKIKKVFNNFPYGFIFNGIIILILIFFY